MRITKTDLLEFCQRHRSVLTITGIAGALILIAGVIFDEDFLALVVFFTAALMLINSNIDQRWEGSDDE